MVEMSESSHLTDQVKMLIGEIMNYYIFDMPRQETLICALENLSKQYFSSDGVSLKIRVPRGSDLYNAAYEYALDLYSRQSLIVSEENMTE